ncbi:class I SAM-dependent methyltransferase [Reyranella sp.]|uniref:class I SAM-dependent methyltransferase n=1 Tax=Reyranella sp. TaxID=1929291 RepID=UPI003BAB81E7
MEIAKVEPGVSGPNTGILRTQTFRYILDNLIQSPKGSRLVDLGAGPCIFSRISAGRGFDVTAVDGRDERKPDDLEVPFVKSDVRTFDVSDFQVILIIGLLYHLTLDDQIDLLSRCPKSSELVVDTQVHIPELVGAASAAERQGFADRPVSDRGYGGILFPEADNPMAAIGNRVSWWHTEPSLMTLFENAGFEHVTEVAPPYTSKYGARRWYVVSNPRALDARLSGTAA